MVAILETLDLMTHIQQPFLAEASQFLKVQAILQDGSVALEFMTDDPTEAKEMRQQMLALDLRGRGPSVKHALVLDEPGWVQI